MKRQRSPSLDKIITFQIKTQHSPLQAYDPDLIYAAQNKLRVGYNYCCQRQQVRLFKKVKHNNQIYNKEDFVYLYDRTDQNPFVAKITKIIQLPNQFETLPFLQVEWYLKKNDLPRIQKYKKYYDHMSVNEVFPSGQLQYVYIESIKKKVTILSRKEFEQLSGVNDNIIFTRAKYNHDSLSLSPQPQEWQTSCICKMPINPDQQYTQCQSCEQWFHNKCIIQDLKKIGEEDSYFCQACQNSKKSLKQKAKSKKQKSSNKKEKKSQQILDKSLNKSRNEKKNDSRSNIHSQTKKVAQKKQNSFKSGNKEEQKKAKYIQKKQYHHQ